MRIFLSVGEPSGDLHGSNLIREIRKLQTNCEFVGFGGPNMEKAGCQLDKDMSDLAIMGFARVLPHVKTFWNLLKLADQRFKDSPPDAVVLIDYPGFNWWIARSAKKHGVPVFYYGTPQIWAWATHRVRKLRRLVDHSLCKLPFEPSWYRDRGCDATYVGHPYFDDFIDQQLDDEFVHSLGPNPLLTILPGSRRHEVQNNLPAFLDTIDVVQQRLPDVTFAIASYDDKQAEMARQTVMQHGGHARPSVYVDRTRELIHRSTCCLACSGSVSLELLHEAKPTVIHYKTDTVGYFLQKQFRRCKFITLVNLLNSEHRFEYKQAYDPNDLTMLGEAPFPEYLTVDDCAHEMAEHLVRWLTDANALSESIASLEPMRKSFVKAGASASAAAYILHHLQHAEEDSEATFSSKKVA